MKKAGICVCSNGYKEDRRYQIDDLVNVINAMDIDPLLSPHIFCHTDEFSASDQERAKALMDMYQDIDIQHIFDISGGDLANGLIKYLDFDVIKKSNTTFWGYSDLTTIINAIYSQTGKSSVLYQIKNVISKNRDIQQRRVKDYFNDASKDLFDVNYDFLQGDCMEGIVVGGNIRCFLKLAGSKYWPDMKGKILLLESLGGECGKIATLINQLDMMGVFDEISGIILGTFTSYDRAGLSLSVYDLLKMHISRNLPVAKTSEIGHGSDAKAIFIGKELSIAK